MKFSLITLVVAAIASTVVAQQIMLPSQPAFNAVGKVTSAPAIPSRFLEAPKGAMLDTIDSGNTNAIIILLQGWLFNFSFALAL
ncbi:uncharacterized protein L3040_003160 [Drepanopeziza brunnea f. sp. 'multigermtubi']|uniref:uncharacterized protein n=1 Tax=Drepanopeziza brunnea f. sp. 'multigermtubi' TaxID=698441 RepID=UPI0023839123|nr:hypothetical protein L3040_003160 [Drepanopeziza brunnea f. sp. 'multigermtubi']